jgi:hypothetical protein
MHLLAERFVFYEGRSRFYEHLVTTRPLAPMAPINEHILYLYSHLYNY